MAKSCGDELTDSALTQFQPSIFVENGLAFIEIWSMVFTLKAGSL
jgi:hypothetical protein